MTLHSHDLAIAGREREQAALRGMLDAAIQGRGRLSLIGGEAGIGKTSLVEWLRAQAEADDALVVTGACYDLTVTPPFNPWIEAFTSPALDRNRAAIRDLLAPTTAERGATSQARMFDDVYAALADVTRERPLVITLEDMHWSDTASLDLLRFLARTIGAQPMLVLATFRTDELTRHNHLYQLLPTLAREARAERVDVGPLRAEALAEIVQSRYDLAGDDAARLVDFLQARAEGNPFFIQELLRTLEFERILCADADRWSLGNLRDAPVPPLLRQIIDARLERLDDTTRRLLDIAAVIGYVVPLDLWQAAGGADDDTLLATLTTVRDERLMMQGPGGASMRFDHALTREALYAAMIPVQRRALHRVAGEVLEAAERADPDTVAHHFQRAGDDRACDWLLRAGERATQVYAWVMAVERYEEAIRLLEGMPQQGSRRGWLLHLVAMLYRWIDPSRGIAHLDEAVSIAESTGDRTLAAVARAYRGVLLCYSGQVRRGIAAMDAGADEFDRLTVDERSAVAFGVNPVRGTLCVWLVGAGQVMECVANAEALEQTTADFDVRQLGGRYIGDNHPATVAATQIGCMYNALGAAQALLGNPEEARRNLVSAADIFGAIRHHAMRSNCLLDLLQYVQLPYFTGQLAARLDAADGAETEWAQTGGAIPEGTLSRARRAPLLYIEGEWDEIERLSSSAQRSFSNLRASAQGAVPLGHIARHRGDWNVAWRCVSSATPDGPESEPGELDFMSAIAAQRLAVALALDANDLPLARSWLDACERWMAWSGAWLGRAELELLRAEYRAAEGDDAGSRAFAKQALEIASSPPQPLSLLAIHRFLGEMNTRSGDHDAASQHLEEARQLADACSAPFERALALTALAELAAARSDAAAAQAYADEARSICELLSAQPALDRIERIAATGHAAGGPVISPTSILSPRELDVLRLLVDGQSNQEIAATLFISPNTVANHVANIMNKLGVDSRTAAATWAVRHGVS